MDPSLSRKKDRESKRLKYESYREAQKKRVLDLQGKNKDDRIRRMIAKYSKLVYSRRELINKYLIHIKALERQLFGCIRQKEKYQQLDRNRKNGQRNLRD